MKILQLLALVGLMTWLGAVAWAQAANPPDEPEPLSILRGRPDQPGADPALGEVFRSEAHGIQFQPPRGMKPTRRGDADIAQFTDEQRGWSLVAGRVILNTPTLLSAQQSPPSNPAPGLLESTVQQLKAGDPGIEIVRQDVINIGEAEVGMIAARIPGQKRTLWQQAIIQANDQLYYTLRLTTPAAAPGDDGKTPEDDPREAESAEAFSNMLDTVVLLDRSQIRDDQDQRLFRTRALYVNLTPPRIQAALLPEQVLRILKDGKDIGYSHIVEKPEERGVNKGVNISIRTRTVVAPPKAEAPAATRPAAAQTDAEAALWVTYDRNHEEWSRIVTIDRGREQITELGVSDRQISRIAQPTPALAPRTDGDNPPVRESERYTLNVTTISRRTNAEPVKVDLPPFYLPQALGHLMPRLVPLSETKGYMFYSYVSERGKVMARYIDVGDESEATLGGKKVRAVPVRDRIGIEGAVTSHWISPDGKYLGSTNEETGVTLLAADENAIRAIWPDAKFTKGE